MEEKEVKAALDAFENDDFITAKEKLKAEIGKAKENFLKTKLGITGAIFTPTAPAIPAEPEPAPAPVPEPTPEPTSVKKRRLMRK
jgi:hypothetical protein